MKPTTTSTTPIDVLLIGAGIMSSTLAVMLKEIAPELNMELHETLASEAQESSNAWNNAGTGHAALCEMNYTPESTDGHIEVSQALKINTEFDISRQLWAYLVTKGAISDPQLFLHAVPHHSFVTGEHNVAFLKKRVAALTAHPCYAGMEYTEDPIQIAEWTPLIMEGREETHALAMTRMNTGTDVNYGALTSLLLRSLQKTDGFSTHFLSEIKKLTREDDHWNISILDKKTHQHRSIAAKFVFIGAGGAALTLLQKSGIPEGSGYAGFPVSGVWLRCDNESIAARHNAKVYGKASAGSPPMSVPHLDRRHIDGKLALLFGPFAGFSTKFLKHGSYLDFFRSINFHNLFPLLDVGRDDMDLTEYLIGQVLESFEARLDALRAFYPRAQHADWRPEVAGQRVQIIKRDPVHGGILQFGTELIKSADNSLLALLGASPGASTAASIAVQIIEQCFASILQNPTGIAAMQRIIPSYGHSLIKETDLCKQIRDKTARELNINAS